MTDSGEYGHMQEETVAGWMKRLKIQISSYKPERVWNNNQTGCFNRALLDKSLAEVKKDPGVVRKQKKAHSFYNATSIKSFHTTLTLVRDLVKFLEEKGEEKAAEDQHKVISAL